MVTRVLKADLQHFLEREGIAFIDERRCIIASAPKAYEVRKDLRITLCNFFSSAERLGHSITESLMSQA